MERDSLLADRLPHEGDDAGGEGKPELLAKKRELQDFCTGAIIGHAGANERTTATIDSCTNTNNTLTATDGDVWKVVVGTAQLGNVVITNITESGNTLAQYSDAEKTTSVPVETGVKRNCYGRAVLGSTGALTIDGEKITL